MQITKRPCCHHVGLSNVWAPPYTPYMAQELLSDPERHAACRSCVEHTSSMLFVITSVHCHCRGTLPYMAPELVSDPERVSEKADVWSLGMVLWEMLTRQVPFTHLTPQQIIAGLMVGNLQPEVSTAKGSHKQQHRKTFTSNWPTQHLQYCCRLRGCTLAFASHQHVR